VIEQRRAARHDESSPVTLRLGELELEATLVNLSASGALVRVASRWPVGPQAVGQPVVFLAWYDVGALLRSRGTVVRFFEDTEGKLLAVRYLPD